MDEITELTMKVLNLQARILEIEMRLEKVEEDNKLIRAEKGWDTGGIHDDYVKKSVSLIRNVCDGEIKFMSEDWKREFKAIYGDNFCPKYGTEINLK